MSKLGWKFFAASAALVTMTVSNASAQNHVSIPDNLSSNFYDVRNAPDGDIVQAQGFGTAYNNIQAPTNLLYAGNIIQRLDIQGGGLQNFAIVQSAAYEPDKVLRAYDRTKLIQRSDAAVFAAAARIITVGGVTATLLTFGPGSNSSASGCASRGTLKDAADNPPLGNYSCVAGVCVGAEDDVFATGTFKTECNQAGLASLAGLPSAGQELVTAVFPPDAGETGFKAVAKNLPNVAN